MENLAFHVAIVWQKDSSGQYEQRLLTSTYFVEDGQVKDADAALGKAINDHGKELGGLSHYKMTMHRVWSTYNTTRKADLSCLRYC